MLFAHFSSLKPKKWFLMEKFVWNSLRRIEKAKIKIEIF